ncbi:prion-(Q/N-rich) domain-bearing protein 25 [Biomphalaria glabrata]|nr:prion-(Q/N-rich) domain-bearing protein 25 [Biomphalaria glabrata]
MWNFCSVFLWTFLSIYMIKQTQAYTRCTKPDTRKTAYSGSFLHFTSHYLPPHPLPNPVSITMDLAELASDFEAEGILGGFEGLELEDYVRRRIERAQRMEEREAKFKQEMEEMDKAHAQEILEIRHRYRQQSLELNGTPARLDQETEESETTTHVQIEYTAQTDLEVAAKDETFIPDIPPLDDSTLSTQPNPPAHGSFLHFTSHYLPPHPLPNPVSITMDLAELASDFEAEGILGGFEGLELEDYVRRRIERAQRMEEREAKFKQEMEEMDKAHAQEILEIRHRYRQQSLELNGTPARLDQETEESETTTHVQIEYTAQTDLEVAAKDETFIPDIPPLDDSTLSTQPNPPAQSNSPTNCDAPIQPMPPSQPQPKKAPVQQPALHKNGNFPANSGSIHTLAGECGYLASPSSVSTGSLVTWSIRGENGTYTTIIVLEINMNPTSCSTNYLEILENSSTLLSKTCDGSYNMPRFHASKSNNTLTVSYRKASSGYRGFRAIYYTRRDYSELNETMGYIVSPGYPVSYTTRLNNTWLIATEPGHIIKTTFLVDTENTRDYVRVYDGRYLFSSTLTTLTGSVSLRTVTSTANYMLIQFTTDYSVNRAGFRATYEVYDLGYGNRCSSISLCTPGLTCLDGHCACPTTQYYNPINGFCLSRVSFRNPCPLSEECLQGLVCRESVCLCLTTQYYQYSSGTCKNGVVYGKDCTNSNCVDGLNCYLGVCNCSSNQYYDRSFGICKVRIAHGNSCSGTEQCVVGLICTGTKCGCLTSHYYDFSSSTCRTSKCPANSYYYNSTCLAKVGYGQSCTNSNCVDGLYCYSGVCNCSSNQYYDRSFGICKIRITYGNSCNSTEQCVAGLSCIGARCGCLTSHYYDLSYLTCKSRLSYESYCTSASQCQQDFVCTGNYCRCSTNTYYNSRTCVAKLSHAVSSCSSSDECLSPYVCRYEKNFLKVCLCPSDMYFDTSYCQNYSALQARVSNSSIVKTDSILLKWTTPTWKSMFSFTVEWGRKYVLTNTSELYVDGLLPGSTYYFTITTNIPGDDYYNNKSVQSKSSIVTKQVPGNTCSSNYTCSENASCVYGVCTCLSQFYLNRVSKTCEPRQIKGYECSRTDECKNTMICVNRRCDCQSEFYYDNNKQDCFGALKKGQLCDPSIENVCELPDLICSRESIYTTNYTCQQKYTNSDEIVSHETTDEHNNTVSIAVAVVGWVAALVAFITVIILCSRIRRKSSTNGSKDTTATVHDLRRSNISTVPPKNDYRSFPTTTDPQSTTSTTSAPDVSPVQSTVPAMTSAKPSTSAKTNNATVSVKPKFVYDNKTYTPDLAKKNESQYDEIDMEQILAAYIHEDSNDQVYQNVQIQKENEYNNSNI